MAPLSLSQAQVDDYHTKGFLVLRAKEHNLINPAELQAWANEVQNWPRVAGKWMPYDEVNADGQKQLMRTEKFADYHEQFRTFLFGEGIANLLEQISSDVSLEYLPQVLR
jgi:hypothetical protein